MNKFYAGLGLFLVLILFNGNMGYIYIGWSILLVLSLLVDSSNRKKVTYYQSIKLERSNFYITGFNWMAIIFNKTEIIFQFLKHVLIKIGAY